MKKIGLVGGTGPESTLMYYKILNTEIDRITNGEAMPDIAIESVNFTRAWNYVTEGRFDLLADYLYEKLDCLDKGGSEVISLTAVTMHVVYDELAARFNKPIVSITKAVCEEVQAKGIKRIGLLGTIFMYFLHRKTHHAKSKMLFYFRKRSSCHICPLPII